jgi:hypothetical protein
VHVVLKKNRKKFHKKPGICASNIVYSRLSRLGKPIRAIGVEFSQQAERI